MCYLFNLLSSSPGWMKAVLFVILTIFHVLPICISKMQPLYEMFEDTKGIIRSRISKYRQRNGQTLEDTKGIIRSCKSKNRKHNDQKA